MDRLITVRDVKARYGCSLPTARKYIRQCNPHMESPLATYEWAFREWEQSRIVAFPGMKRRMASKQRERVIVPKRR